jgi:hypothetical protein
VGGAGHDTVILDDSADSSDNVGNSSAFLEKREGIPDPVEVGVVAGLDMQMTVPVPPDQGGGVEVVDGHVELESVEVLEVRMGTGDDVFTVGGELNVNVDDPEGNGGKWNAVSLTDALVPPTRLENPDTGFGITGNAYSISGMTVIRGGDGEDDIRVLRTQDSPDQRDLLNQPSVLVTASDTGDAGHQDGDRTIPQSEIVRIDIKAEVGYFVLEFTDRSLDDTDPSGDDTVPSAEQTVVLPFDITAAELKEALGALRLVGGTEFIDSVVDEGPDPAPGVVRRFTVTFSSQLDDLPALRAFDTKLLVAGEGGDDELSVQSIDQPTYVLGGEVLGVDTGADDDDQDTLNVNVQIGINGPELASAPDGSTRSRRPRRKRTASTRTHGRRRPRRRQVLRQPVRRGRRFPDQPVRFGCDDGRRGHRLRNRGARHVPAARRGGERRARVCGPHQAAAGTGARHARYPRRARQLPRLAGQHEGLRAGGRRHLRHRRHAARSGDLRRRGRGLLPGRAALQVAAQRRGGRPVRGRLRHHRDHARIPVERHQQPDEDLRRRRQ